jgi:UPF0755 protein
MPFTLASLRRGRLVLLLAALLVVARLGRMEIDETYDAPGPLPQAQDIVIPTGPAADTAAVLRRAGAIRHGLIFRAAAWATRHDGPIHAGEFRFPARASLREILEILRHAAPVEHQVTFPEGLTGAQLAAILNAAPDASGHVAPPPDGAILPQTYDFTRGTPRPAILLRAEAAMRQALQTAWAARDPSIPLTSPQQALTLASIVQQETPLAAELPEIAAVYENRLAHGMRLQADPTVIFAATDGRVSGGQPVTRANLANPSPYNTYMYAGLPPGPISTPGIAAIQAVLHPAQSQALFFVATGDGGHVFADNFQEQLQHIKQYRAALAARD